MRLRLALEALELGYDLACFLQCVLEMLLALREEQIARDIRQKLHDEGIIDEVE